MAGRRRTKDAKRRAKEAIAAAAAECSPTRVRMAMPGPNSGTDERVRYIAELMSMATYDGFVTRAVLAEAWGLSDSRVRNLAAEAHRLVLGDRDDLEQLKVVLASALRIARERAEAHPNQLTGMYDTAGIVQCIRAHAEIMGLDKLSSTDCGAAPIIEIKLLPPDADEKNP